MIFIPKERPFSKEWIKNYFLIVIGAFIMASGYVFFITPFKIVPGGVFGISIVIHYLTKGIFSFAPDGLPVGIMGLIMNIPLTIIGIRILGPRFGVKTIIGYILASAFIDIQTYFWGDEPLAKDDPLLSAIFGAVLIGFGLGLIFKAKATSGGSDVIAMILRSTQKCLSGSCLFMSIRLLYFWDWSSSRTGKFLYIPGL